MIVSKRRTHFNRLIWENTSSLLNKELSCWRKCLMLRLKEVRTEHKEHAGYDESCQTMHSRYVKTFTNSMNESYCRCPKHKKVRTSEPVTNSGVGKHISNHASSVAATRGEDIIKVIYHQHQNIGLSSEWVVYEDMPWETS